MQIIKNYFCSLLLASLYVSTLSAQSPWFTASLTAVADNAPGTVVTADFNSDGKMDVATGNYSSNSVSVLIGQGTGAFNAPVNYQVGVPANSQGISKPFIVTADFNNDGKPDLATGNANSANVLSVLLNGGSGIFAPAVNYTACAGVNFVTTGDLNGDGNTDIVMATGGNALSVFLNSGTGVFPGCSTYTLSSWCSLITSGDFNGDGRDDIAAMQSGAQVTILLGSASGILTAGTSFPHTGFPNFILADDFNADGKADLGVCNLGLQLFSIYSGDGAGSFTLTFTCSVTGARAFCVKDLNNDGKKDIAVSGEDYVTVLQGLGNGNFSYQGIYMTCSDAAGISSADFNMDNMPDLCVGAKHPSGSVSSNNLVVILLNQSATGFQNYLSAESQAVIYPNPAGAFFRLRISHLSPNMCVEVADLLGRPVLVQALGEQEVDVSLWGQKQGVYVVKVIEKGKTLQSVRLVKIND